MMATPLQQVKERFETKGALVKALESLSKGGLWIDRLNEDKGLGRVSNAKLLHLHSVLETVKARFGKRDSLIDEILTLEKRSKDKDYRTRFEAWSTPRLWDHFKALEKRVRAAS